MSLTHAADMAALANRFFGAIESMIAAALSFEPAFEKSVSASTFRIVLPASCGGTLPFAMRRAACSTTVS